MNPIVLLALAAGAAFLFMGSAKKTWTRVTKLSSGVVYRVSRPAGSSPALKASYGGTKPADWPTDDTAGGAREYGTIDYVSYGPDGKTVIQTTGDDPAALWGDDAATWSFWQ